MNMETPRTDKAVKESNGQWSYALVDTCKQLERELAAAREQIKANHKGCELIERMVYEARQQRDTLAEAAQAVVDRWDAPTWKDLEPTAKVINALRKAIAAVKGGSDE